jgi:ribose/xylose/arabinose/galactoside ABC-type transport system permease subunit
VKHDVTGTVEAGHAAIAEVTEIREQTWFQRVLASQPFWVTVALAILVAIMTAMEPSFGTSDNAANVTRNFAPFGIMALGMTVVIITGGIDLSVGSVMGLVAIVAGLFLTWEYSWPVAFIMGLLAGIICGAVNGFFVAYVGMPSFVVTLGMLSIALQIRAGCRQSQSHRAGQVASARARGLGTALDSTTVLTFLDNGCLCTGIGIRFQFHGLGATPFCDWRQ